MRWLILSLLAFAAPAAPDERSFMLGSFERIRVDGPFEVHVTTGSPRATAEGDAKALQQIAVRVEGTTLIVSANASDWNDGFANRTTPPVVTVTVPRLRAALLNGGGRLGIDGLESQRVDLTLNGAGTIDARGIAADDLVVTLTGTGAVTLAGRSERARYRSAGAGTLDATALTAKDVVLQAESAGDSRVTALNTATVGAIGIGSVVVQGGAACTVRGSGPVSC